MSRTYLFYKWRHDAGLGYKLAMALGFAGLTGLGAQLRIPLPFTPVPITAQVFFVLLSGVVLGRLGFVSQLLYASLGTLGVPWFSGLQAGPAIILGPRGGYIIGFVFASFATGWFTDRYLGARTLRYQMFLSFLGISIIYFLGASWLSVVLKTDIAGTLFLAVLPFIPGEILKALGVAAIGGYMAPKVAYDGEVDISIKKPWLNKLALLGSLALTSIFIILFWIDLLGMREPSPDLPFKVLAYGLAVLGVGLVTLLSALGRRG